MQHPSAVTGRGNDPHARRRHCDIVGFALPSFPRTRQQPHSLDISESHARFVSSLSSRLFCLI
jgi:hypothetical protein